MFVHVSAEEASSVISHQCVTLTATCPFHDLHNVPFFLEGTLWRSVLSQEVRNTDVYILLTHS